MARVPYRTKGSERLVHTLSVPVTQEMYDRLHEAARREERPLVWVMRRYLSMGLETKAPEEAHASAG